MKKKLAALALCIVMTGALTACGGEISNDNIAIKQYKGLEVAEVAKPEKVTDEYVENTMKSYLGATLETEGTAENGDTVSLNYVGKVDDVAFDGGTANGTTLELGSGTYIGPNGDYKGFEEQIVGHNVGETFDIEVKFPADYHDAGMADKVAVFTVTINGKYPDITDEWVQKVSKESKTVDEFRKEIRGNIEEYNKEKVQSQLRTEVMDALMKEVEVKELPQEAVDTEVAKMREYYTGMAVQYEMEFPEFLTTYLGMDEKTFETKAKEEAEKAVARKLACQLIAEKQHLLPSEEEVKEKTEEFAVQTGYDDVESFKKDFGEDVIYDTIVQQKVSDYLVDKCVQVEAKEEPAAK